MDHIKNVWAMTYAEFDTLVRLTWPQKQDFECVAEFEWCNDSDHFKADVSAVFVPDFQDWLDGGNNHSIGEYQILEMLVHGGHLEPGNYLIKYF